MNIGILGSGDVGKTLGSGFVKHGHKVMLGTRDTAKLADWAKANAGARVGGFAEVARFAEVAVLAVAGGVALEVVRAADPANLAGKTVIDACNPIAGPPPASGVLRFSTSLDESLMERLQRGFPAVRFVKAFNSVGAALMVDPKVKGGPPTMFICGNDEGAKETVGRMLNQFGWESEDMGPAEAARAIEPLCMLWCIPGFRKGDWTHAFKVLRP